MQEGSSEMRRIKVRAVQARCGMPSITWSYSAYAELSREVETLGTLAAVFHPWSRPPFPCFLSGLCPKCHPPTSRVSIVVPQFLAEIFVYLSCKWVFWLHFNWMKASWLIWLCGIKASGTQVQQMVHCLWWDDLYGWNSKHHVLEIINPPTVVGEIKFTYLEVPLAPIHRILIW